MGRPYSMDLRESRQPETLRPPARGAISAPIPLDAPVTTATLCASLPIEPSIWMPISITLSEAVRYQAAAPAPQPLSGAQ